MSKVKRRVDEAGKGLSNSIKSFSIRITTKLLRVAKEIIVTIKE